MVTSKQLQGVAADGAVSALRQHMRHPAAPVFDAWDVRHDLT